MMRGSGCCLARASARISAARSDSRGNGITWKRVEGAASSAARISGATCVSVWWQSEFLSLSTYILDPNALDTSMRTSSWPSMSHTR